MVSFGVRREESCKAVALCCASDITSERQRTLSIRKERERKKGVDQQDFQVRGSSFTPSFTLSVGK